VFRKWAGSTDDFDTYDIRGRDKSWVSKRLSWTANGIFGEMGRVKALTETLMETNSCRAVRGNPLMLSQFHRLSLVRMLGPLVDGMVEVFIFRGAVFSAAKKQTLLAYRAHPSGVR